MVHSNVTGMNAGQLLNGRPPTLIGIRDRGDPVLEQEAAQAAHETADEHDERQPAVVRAHGFVQFLDRKRRIGIHAPVPLGARLRRRRHQRTGIVELRHQTVKPARHHSGSTLASGSIERISKIEIIGRKRRNRNSRARNSPIVPANVDQSQNVGEYLPHDEGRKSRLRLVTMMMNRSSHMPTLTTREIAKRAATFVRTRLNHNSCGTTMLQKSSAQYRGHTARSSD